MSTLLIGISILYRTIFNLLNYKKIALNTTFKRFYYPDIYKPSIMTFVIYTKIFYLVLCFFLIYYDLSLFKYCFQNKTAMAESSKYVFQCA